MRGQRLRVAGGWSHKYL